MQYSALIVLAVISGLAIAAPAAEPRDLVARDCAKAIRSFNLERRAKRGLDRRSMITSIPNLSNACIAAPNVPLLNYVAQPPIRADVTEGQEGIPLILDVGVMDVTTCTPMTNTMVEVWSPNAQGNYGSFLRGAQATSSSGIVEFQTIFPGFPSGAANHINLMVHQNTMTSPVSHVGQVFFTDRWTDVVSLKAPYNTNTNVRMTNAQDPAYAKASAQGYSAIVDIESIHDDWPEGVIGYISKCTNVMVVFVDDIDEFDTRTLAMGVNPTRAS
ncbi:hypothetical protein HGRIS_008343 [Hohenbuehelia grisea]|uniref:Intradiol ring-cleavage dioxygenases domain-containing protein n=1 Tax=Hohenbuehelia grisea TaxID=104357 RepID=A0ABR3J7N0_9AGAR